MTAQLLSARFTGFDFLRYFMAQADFLYCKIRGKFLCR